MPKYRTDRFTDWGKFSKKMSYALRHAGYAMNKRAKLQSLLLAEQFLADENAKWPHSTVMANGARFGGDHDHPWYSGHLHDSVAIRIAEGGKTVGVRYMPPSPDTGEPQHMSAEDGMKIDRIIGTEWAVRGVNDAARYSHFFEPGIQIQFIVGVPYASKVNETGRHLGYFDSMANELINVFNTYDWTGMFNRTGVVADDKGVRISSSKGIRKI